jgi:D-amino peptidase
MKIMSAFHKKILIIADIEGSSGCYSYHDTLPFKKGWPRACAEMSRDVDAAVRALFDAGAEDVAVKDFHRTGYNLIPAMIDRRAELIPGYRQGPVPGIGSAEGYTALIMTGMHPPSGAGGFLAHTMTSRISRLELNGALLTEAELFAAFLASAGLRPVLISGTADACGYASRALKGIRVYPLERGDGFDADVWRRGLYEAVRLAAADPGPEPYSPAGPFEARLTMRDGAESAIKHAAPWGFNFEHDTIILRADSLSGIYYDLIRLCYLSPFIEKFLAPSLALYNSYGYLGNLWARIMLRLSP